MRCSLKDGFVILLIFFFSPSEEKYRNPLLLYKNSIADHSKNFNDFLVMSRVEQSLDSFPNLEEYDKNAHKIVKKQMTAADYKRAQKNKRSVFSLKGNSICERDLKSKKRDKIEETMSDCGATCRKKKSDFPESASKHHRDLETEKLFLTKALIEGDPVFRRSLLGKKQKQKKVTENDSHQTVEKESNEIERGKENIVARVAEKTSEKQKENTVARVTEKTSEKQKEVLEKAIANATAKAEKEVEKSTVKATENTTGKEKDKASEKAKGKAKENENLKKNNDSDKKNNFGKQIDKNMEEQCKLLKNMVGSNMDKFCRFPDFQDNHCYFECESDSDGCIKLTHKHCPGDEIFSTRFLECLQPFFWKMVEREKRSLWKKGKKQQYSNAWANGQSSNTWMDVTHEEGKQLPSEFRPKYKPKLVVYHLKVKKAINEPLRKRRKERRHASDTPRLQDADTSSTLRDKVTNAKSRYHQLFPRSFIIRVNKKGENDYEESTSENEKDETEEDGDEEDDEEDDDVSEETNDKEENTESDAEDKKPAEKSGIKEFFKSAKEAITNKARFSEPADTSFTLDKTNPYPKNKNFDDSEKDSRKILIDADIKVDKTLGKTLKRILGKRKNKDDGIGLFNGSLLSDRGIRDQVESEQITAYENLIRSNPRLKRYSY